MVERATTEVLSLSAEGVNNGSFNPTTPNTTSGVLPDCVAAIT